jgi:hypothetical protein
MKKRSTLRIWEKNRPVVGASRKSILKKRFSNAYFSVRKFSLGVSLGVSCVFLICPSQTPRKRTESAHWIKTTKFKCILFEQVLGKLVKIGTCSSLNDSKVVPFDINNLVPAYQERLRVSSGKDTGQRGCEHARRKYVHNPWRFMMCPYTVRTTCMLAGHEALPRSACLLATERSYLKKKNRLVIGKRRNLHVW